jgi:hypothetical protein
MGRWEEAGLNRDLILIRKSTVSGHAGSVRVSPDPIGMQWMVR